LKTADVLKIKELVEKARRLKETMKNIHTVKVKY